MILKRLTISVLAMSMLVGGFLFAEGQQEGADSVTLTLATYHPSEGYRSMGSRLLKEEIEKHTDGKVKIDIYFGGSLLKSDEMLTGIQRGVTDIGLVTPDYYPSQLPLNAAMLVYPNVPSTMQEKAEAMSRMYEKYPELEKEFSEYNQKILFRNFPQPLGLISSKPINNLGDFEGKKVRAAGEVFLKMLGSAGATPVSLPFEDCYMALQTGTLDGVLTNIDAINSQKMYEPAPYSFTHENFSMWLAFTYTINQDVWDKLSAETQQQIQEAVKVVEERMAAAYDKEYARILEEQRDNGTTVVKASQADLRAWSTLPVVSELKADYAEKAEDAGVADGEQMVKDIESILADY